MTDKRKRPLRIVAGIASLAILASACGSDKKSGDDNPTTAPAASTTSSVEVPTGGTLTIGAEQEPDCFDWIGSCGGSSWGYWMAGVQTTPAALTPEKQADGTYQYVASNLLTGEPVLETDPVQKVTYEINPDAVWSDGVAITCDDFEYTWDQVANGEDVYDPTGYTDIEKVDCTDPSSPVVVWKKGAVYSGWKQLFGAGYGVWPSHLLKGKDRNAETKDGYDWSGGPWLAKWTKGDNVTLTPNDKYWGTKPKLEKVVFKIQSDTAAQFQSFKSGQVQAIYPQPQLDVIDAIGAGIPKSKSVVNAQTGSLEALWINTSRAPLDSVEVRQALAYSIDRDTIVKQLFGKVGVEKAANSLNPFILAEFSDQESFAGYKLDLAKAEELLTGEGWAKGSDGFYAKDGKTLGFEIKTTEGNKRRQTTLIALQQVLKQAGFDVKITFRKAGDLFGTDGPNGDFDVALYAQVLTAITPGLCGQFCTDSIPTAANGSTGNNWQRFSDPDVDEQLEIIESSLDADKQKAAAKAADKLLAENMASLPLDPLPNIIIWSETVIGPIGDQAVLGPFWNLNEWGCTGGKCA